jgi:hypothetical protein
MYASLFAVDAGSDIAEFTASYTLPMAIAGASYLARQATGELF